MNHKLIEEKVLTIAQKSAQKLAYEIVDIEYKMGSKHDLLSIFIYKKEGIDLDDCAKMSHEIENELDNLQILSRPYYLEISSPGLDRPLKTKDDYRRNLENEVEIKLYGPYEGKKDFIGILKNYDADKIFIESENNEEIIIPIKNISSIKQVIKF